MNSNHHSRQPNLGARTCLAGTLAALLLAPGPASAGRSRTPPASLAEVNQALEGRQATIELADGTTVPPAKMVHVGPESTFFRVGDEGREVPTVEIARITGLGRRRIVAPAILGLGLGAALGMASARADSSSSPLDVYAETAGLAVGAVVGAGLGALAGALVKGSAHVVYEAPLARYLEVESLENAAAGAE